MLSRPLGTHLPADGTKPAWELTSAMSSLGMEGSEVHPRCSTTLVAGEKEDGGFSASLLDKSHS